MQSAIAIRRATADDAAVVERLAALDSAAVPRGDILIAEVGGEPQAALELTTGATVADPFRPTAQLVELLRVRAARVAPRPSRTRLRLRTRAAIGTA